MSILNGSQTEELVNALSKAFSTRAKLSMMLLYKLDENLDALTSENVGIETATFKLVEEYERRDLTIQLINAAHQANPTNRKLLKIAQRYELGIGLSVDGNSQQQRQAEKIIKELNKFLDIDVWMKKCGETEVRVCRIAGEAGPIGTGFLVGPDVVMTNDHVAQDSVFQSNPESIVCQFDYKQVDGTTLNPGKEYRLDEDWLVASSPNEERAKGTFTDNPGKDTLDYALLRLDQRAGKKSLINPAIEEKESERGWFQLATTPYDFQPNSPLIILQHPGGEPLKMAIETQAIQGMTPDGVMVKYNTNAMPGSSGSPCFDLDWNLVAIHHSGARQFNGGTPISLIVEDLKQQLGEQKMKEILGLEQ